LVIESESVKNTATRRKCSSPCIRLDSWKSSSSLSTEAGSEQKVSMLSSRYQLRASSTTLNIRKNSWSTSLRPGSDSARDSFRTPVGHSGSQNSSGAPPFHRRIECGLGFVLMRTVQTPVFLRQSRNCSFQNTLKRYSRSIVAGYNNKNNNNTFNLYSAFLVPKAASHTIKSIWGTFFKTRFCEMEGRMINR